MKHYTMNVGLDTSVVVRSAYKLPHVRVLDAGK